MPLVYYISTPSHERTYYLRNVASCFACRTGNGFTSHHVGELIFADDDKIALGQFTLCKVDAL
ncbi:protein of unknown function [Cupriavidus neocaledonicus]|uniref:Uncharacterized protein n=1 Tax=Cupriavidus neocaledonicus TaxID=1040979 RepID=A0A375HDQ7_9BURK|nr:protein of unknown function [Cupriavidus neocaledonicus]